MAAPTTSASKGTPSAGTRSAGTRSKDKGLVGHVTELKDLTVTYLKQETLGPIKGLGRFLGVGLAGSVLLGVGLVLLVLALLRALQTETGEAFDGHWSWGPYFLTVVACAVAAFVAVRAVSSPKRRRR